mgnify:CR=1 FL=1
MDIDFLGSAIDIVEGITIGGLAGLGGEIIAYAVASFPHAFITASLVPPISVMVGALAFIGYSLHNIRGRIHA